MNVLDFGAGFGRQANLWSQSEKDVLYVGMDAIPKSYCLQHIYYSQAEVPLYDYAVNPDGFKIDPDKRGIYHLPTWRYDLLPDNFFDKIVIVQVLQELNGKLVRHMAKQFHRVLKRTGQLYLRDHEQAWRPAHKLDVHEVMSEAGFELEFRAYIRDKEDLWGIPRIYRKRDPKIEENRKISGKQRMNEMVTDLDSKTGGKLKRFIRKVKGNK